MPYEQDSRQREKKFFFNFKFILFCYHIKPFKYIKQIASVDKYMKKNKKETLSGLCNYLGQQEEVIFAYIFGSFIKKVNFRDIDVSIFMRPEPDLIRLGTLQSGISSFTGMQCDLILLNDLHKKNPALAYEIVTQGEVLINKKPEIQLQFKEDVFLHYFDTAYLRKGMENAFARRLETGKFGLRNYE